MALRKWPSGSPHFRPGAPVRAPFPSLGTVGPTRRTNAVGANVCERRGSSERPYARPGRTPFGRTGLLLVAREDTPVEHRRGYRVERAVDPG